MMLIITALVFYALATLFAGMKFYADKSTLKWPTQIIALFAIIAHGGLLYLFIDTSQGQNLSFVNVMSQVVWIIALLVWLANFIDLFESLSVVTYPFAALTIILIRVFPTTNIIATKTQPLNLIHILLALIVFSVFFIAATQAFIIGIQNHLLRKHQTTGLLRRLPPLETMEKLLDQLLMIGFFLLTVVLVTSMLFYNNIFAGALLKHTLFALLAWFVFALVLVGRHGLGWRGITTVRWTLFGVLLLSLSYWLILELF